MTGHTGNPTSSNDPPEGRSIVIGGADLDLLELVLTGALPNALQLTDNALQLTDMAAGQSAGDPVTLTDAENTPVAQLVQSDTASADDPGATTAPAVFEAAALQPLHRGSGAHDDPQLRRAAHQVRSEAGHAPSTTLAVAFSQLPTRTDLALAHSRIREASAGRVLWAALAGRSTDDAAAQTRADALTRAVAATAPAPDGVEVVPLVVGWDPGAEPSVLALADKSAPPGNDLVTAILRGYGADDVVNLTAARSPAHVRELDGLDGAWQREAARLYPAPSVEELSRRSAPGPGQRQGLVVLLTGLSGSGKSTIAKSLAAKLPAATGWDATLLDGDEVRQMLSAGLGFDRESRELNVKRIGYVAGLIAHHGGAAIAAPIAPFASARAYVREQAQRNGRFLLVYVSTPLEVCEQRDRKGLYAKARAGEVAEFTGISSPYEEPADADLIINTSQVSVDDAVDKILRLIIAEQS